MADSGAQKYLTALEKKRKNEERSTGTRKGDAQIAAEQRKRAAKTEDAGARRLTSKPSAPPKPTPKSGLTRDAPAYRGNKTKPSSKQGPTRDAPAYRPGKKKDTSKDGPNVAAVAAAMAGLGAATATVSKLANKPLTAPRPPTPPKPPVRIGNSVVPKNKLGAANQYRAPKYPSYETKPSRPVERSGSATRAGTTASRRARTQANARDASRSSGTKPGGTGARGTGGSWRGTRRRT